MLEITASLVEVPLCYFHVENELGIESGNARAYVIESLSPGMTPAEAASTLSQIASVDILDTYIVDSTQNTDVVLDTYYSQDKGLVMVEDAWSD
jgi:hypothetical protein